MCGLCGLSFVSTDELNNAKIFGENLSSSLIHRGPDDAGIWYDKSNGIGIGHRRLSILDLSSAGHQPMDSSNGGFVIAFNGEIYNHLDIRAEIENLDKKINWRGHSDTETILAAFEVFGVEESIKKFIGMFAFSLWDRKRKVLTLARDRVGEKPMYYGWQNTSFGDVFIFGSELKAVKSFPELNLAIDRGSLSLFLSHAYVPCPHSIYEDIFSLEPGEILEVSIDDKTSKRKKYWDVSEVIKNNTVNKFNGTSSDAVKKLES